MFVECDECGRIRGTFQISARMLSVQLLERFDCCDGSDVFKKIRLASLSLCTVGSSMDMKQGRSSSIGFKGQVVRFADRMQWFLSIINPLQGSTRTNEDRSFCSPSKGSIRHLECGPCPFSS